METNNSFFYYNYLIKNNLNKKIKKNSVVDFNNKESFNFFLNFLLNNQISYFTQTFTQNNQNEILNKKNYWNISNYHDPQTLDLFLLKNKINNFFMVNLIQNDLIEYDTSTKEFNLLNLFLLDQIKIAKINK